MTEKPIRIIRGVHDRDNHYFASTRTTPQNRELSWEARGVLWYLLSKADTWELQPKDLQQGCGRDKVYRILAELQQHRYVIREETRDDYGKFIEFVYKVYEHPFPENAEVVSNPFPDLPDTVLPDTANTDIKELKSSTELENQEKEIPAPQADAESAPELHEVKSTTPLKKKRISPYETEYNALLQSFGIKQVTRSGAAAYWKVAHELYAIAFPADRIRSLYLYVKGRSQRENWSAFTVNALSKYVGDYLRDNPNRIVMPELSEPEELPQVAGGEGQHYAPRAEVADMIAQLTKEKSGNRHDRPTR